MATIDRDLPLPSAKATPGAEPLKPKDLFDRIVLRADPAMARALYELRTTHRLSNQAILWRGVNLVLAEFGRPPVPRPLDTRTRDTDAG